MNYVEVAALIDSTVEFGSKPGLERTSNLLSLLGDSHKKLRAIHIAGTNGKGSTAAMISAILSSAGYTTGMYISPHLYKNTERMTIEGKEISEGDFVRYALEVLDKVRVMEEMGLEKPTQFELYTAMAFLYFERKKVDFAVIEVGLGGRFDATNVVDPVLSVITSIGYDHMDVLGDTIEKIAYEKAGIIKEGSRVVAYPQRFSAAMSVIEEVCREKGTTLIKADTGTVKLKNFGTFGQVIDFRYRGYDIHDMKLSLIGDHQLNNAAVALTTVAELDRAGFAVEEDAIREGLGNVRWPCRMSVVSREPLIIIDGAHNQDGIDSLQSALSKYFGGRKIIFVFGMLRDKDYGYAIRKLMPMAHYTIATEPESERALLADAMAEAVRQHHSAVSAEPDIIKAIDKAVELCDKDSLICICGSLYMAGKAYRYLSASKQLIQNKTQAGQAMDSNTAID